MAHNLKLPRIRKIRDPQVNSIADGFHEDCQELVWRFSRTKSLRYSTFVSIWKEMDFHLVFCGRTSLNELCEFTEEAVNIAGQYLLMWDEDRAAAVAATYLIRALRNVQPEGRAPCLRVIPRMAHAILGLRDFARQEQHFDLLYMLSELLYDGVFRFVAMEREYAIQHSIRKYHENQPSEASVALLRDAHSGVADLSRLLAPQHGGLAALTSVAEAYYKIKSQLPGAKDGCPPKELDYMSPIFPQDIKAKLARIVEDGHPKVRSSNDNESEPSTSNGLAQQQNTILESRRLAKEKLQQYKKRWQMNSSRKAKRKKYGNIRGMVHFPESTEEPPADQGVASLPLLPDTALE